ncbi:MAG: bifunctional DNA-formamidopyrimidine glycosylase/DNA-(apurinic or apyrimidinic site) lyase [Lentisphaeria bacterium]|nr:bifunctional DNA-formamidopyrimidine glycosylase/DNA-(apurinic or apyrimidinic site) lyase [Lentisphaeria bacterium]
MPELPEVETVRAALQLAVAGRTIKRLSHAADRLRYPLDAAGIARATSGQTVKTFRRRAKYIVVDFDDFWGQCLVLHLGMTGSFRLAAVGERLGARDHVVWELEGGDQWIFTDPRKFGEVAVENVAAAGDWPARFAGLGPEPLSSAFSPVYLFNRFKGRKQPVKTAVLDQTIIAGVGNIYASEALFRAGIHPARAAGKISPQRVEKLVLAVKCVLADSIISGGTTIRDFTSLDGKEGHFSLCLDVYGKAGAPCVRCGEKSSIRRIRQAGRSTFYCPGCQR